MCQSNLLETKDHIMWECVYASRFWTGLMAQFNVTFNGGEQNLSVWTKSRSPRSLSRRGIVWAAGAWTLWRERNIRLLSNKKKGASSKTIRQWRLSSGPRVFWKIHWVVI